MIHALELLYRDEFFDCRTPVTQRRGDLRILLVRAQEL
jgi:hypothetical protein